jgi:ribose/xylose/arabinose/galactoside ABC-type transport system permease subunit
MSVAAPTLRRSAPSRFHFGSLARLALLVALVVVFAILSDKFLSPRNIYALLQSFSLLGLVAVGLSLTMIAGEFDLSVGSMVAVSGLVTIVFGGEGLVLGALAAIGFAILIGLANAAIVHWLRVSSLVVTVGTMMALSGLAFWLAGGKVISTDQFGPGFLLDERIAGVFSLRSLVTLAVFVILGLMMRYTLVGRDIRAIGSKRTVAAASGARIGPALTAAFVISAAAAALAGSLLSMSLASASATTGGNILLQAASAAIVGGVALSGGVGSVGGVLVGSLILATMNNGLSLIGMGATGILFANGLVLMVVVLFDGRLGSWLAEQASSRRQANPALRD